MRVRAKHVLCVSESANRCGGGVGRRPYSYSLSSLSASTCCCMPEPPSLPRGNSQMMSARRGGGDGNHADGSSDQFHGCDNEDSEGHNRSQSFMDVIDGWSPRSPCVLCIMHSAPRLPSFLAAIQNQKVSRPKPTYWAKVVVR